MLNKKEPYTESDAIFTISKAFDDINKDGDKYLKILEMYLKQRIEVVRLERSELRDEKDRADYYEFTILACNEFAKMDNVPCEIADHPFFKELDRIGEIDYGN